MLSSKASDILHAVRVLVERWLNLEFPCVENIETLLDRQIGNHSFLADFYPLKTLQVLWLSSTLVISFEDDWDNSDCDWESKDNEDSSWRKAKVVESPESEWVQLRSARSWCTSPLESTKALTSNLLLNLLSSVSSLRYHRSVSCRSIALWLSGTASSSRRIACRGVDCRRRCRNARKWIFRKMIH